MTALGSDACVRLGPGGVAGVEVSVRLTGQSRIYCHLYEDAAPILSITDEHVRMSVSVPDPDQVTPDDVTWGRLLADAVARYVAELEKLAIKDHAAAPGEASGRAA
jgi:hypothetical protein